MEEVHEFCARVLGRGDAADRAAVHAHASGGDDRVERLAAAATACRAATEPGGPEAAPEPGAGESERLAETVARELAAATARLPQRQREALALRELLRLSYDQIARVMGIQPVAVAPLLARARLQLRAQLRGVADPVTECPQRDRTQRACAQRQDVETLGADDVSWLLEHLGECPACKRDHAAMLEGSVCYRAWEVVDRPRGSDPDGRGGQPAGAQTAQ
jgi:RNA polymerase sigma factor (sigma-70 family)